jgi:hypothetical protein
MTDVEFARLLSDLAEQSKRFNDKTDSLNDLIEQFVDKLRSMKPGVEVWLSSPAISSKRWEERDENEEHVIASGTRDRELGFARHENARREKKWQLMVRTARYETNGYGNLVFVESEEEELLEEMSRKVRVQSLTLFPKLVRAIPDEVNAGLKAIEDADKFVK